MVNGANLIAVPLGLLLKCGLHWFLSMRDRKPKLAKNSVSKACGTISLFVTATHHVVWYLHGDFPYIDFRLIVSDPHSSSSVSILFNQQLSWHPRQKNRCKKELPEMFNLSLRHYCWLHRMFWTVHCFLICSYYR
jgi:hypothetical protein